MVKYICNGEFNPTTWVLDFEIGFMVAVKDVFGNDIILIGCYFHLCQSIRRHAVVKLRLKKALNQDPRLALQLRQFMALALVPLASLNMVFELFTDANNLDPRLQPLARYFQVSLLSWSKNFC